ncbi:hypothetical protein [Bartonella sp. MM73XJBT.G]|uniref:hypothetical protein n=1 Tax=Bartonella sp. MM73XJBT.G TaxID=3019097 RepID=UPI00236002BC|nr:hypothetical protein [Bartonella sp. MM73XJBT.G]
MTVIPHIVYETNDNKISAMQRIVENIIRKVIDFEATLILDDMSKKTLSENIFSEKAQIQVIFLEGYDIIFIGKVDWEEIVTISWAILFLKGRTLDTVFTRK